MLFHFVYCDQSGGEKFHQAFFSSEAELKADGNVCKEALCSWQDWSQDKYTRAKIANGSSAYGPHAIIGGTYETGKTKHYLQLCCYLVRTSFWYFYNLWHASVPINPRRRSN